MFACHIYRRLRDRFALRLGRGLRHNYLLRLRLHHLRSLRIGGNHGDCLSLCLGGSQVNHLCVELRHKRLPHLHQFSLAVEGHGPLRGPRSRGHVGKRDDGAPLDRNLQDGWWSGGLKRPQIGDFRRPDLGMHSRQSGVAQPGCQPAGLLVRVLFGADVVKG